MRHVGQITATALVLVALVALPAVARAQDTGWTVTDFHADYVVHLDGSLGVVERIVIDFAELQRHGIFRTIPVVYNRLVSPDARGEFSLQVNGVTNAQGAPIRYEVSGTGRKEIKIGDPDHTVSGEQTYVIDYGVTGGLGFFDAFDELYWQVTGTDWPVPIEHASATVLLPSERALVFADSVPWRVRCFAGGPESTTDAGCTAEVVRPGSYRFETTSPLMPGQGLTLAAAFPKTLIARPAAPERGPVGRP